MKQFHWFALIRFLLVWLLLAQHVLAQHVAQADNTLGGIFTKSPLTEFDGILVTDQQGDTMVDWHSNKPLIPASTLKIMTALLALEKWGESHQFITDFWIDKDQLWVQGYGDPFLISEELDLVVERIVAQLSEQGAERGKAPLTAIKDIVVDGEYFDLSTKQQSLLGRSQVMDPYNAPLSALSANFNTVSVRKTGQSIRSGESQTPLTPTAKRLAQRLGSESTRINLQTSQHAQQHAGELLMLKLNAQGANIRSVKQGKRPDTANLLYRHKNTHTLSDALKGTLFYSTNFIANQVFVLLAQTEDWHPENKELVSLEKAQETVRTRLYEKYKQPFDSIYEGAGLSRQNRMSAQQLNLILAQFRPYQHLLKEYTVKAKTGRYLARAKTGTLNKVRSFAGYIEVKGHSYQFVFLFNRPVPFAYRETVLANLADYLSKTKLSHDKTNHSH